ncbi:glutamate acetyltransferase [Chrysosporum ovalisporum APH033B]|uniref:Glutamate acetyltransferase n=3 Tax=Umezakia ovalisporum TaxID=75695 RepID=A0AA43GZT4_9CYAN|nr:glutamate acetyltransferase [Umezakia ovalisporum FSS-43]MDH6064433.1 glutamate acetyltransferase [Umezakia ovalisporum FSS-62]MDH6068451.1 glutamate acetyltransferase [Umezakia ovalisporum APH033B]MDH6071192.1 glutamate acetyltransferase [Umezakia ovalisporum CobakiLakeA]MDH6074798.1 glutamate acetyltransferase [Umezakia ovalisporum CS-1034]MDH6079441.1 glutamate acetyltransferase [Umezakia ovalisporum FSS-45]MDH6081995.1 glutamate acetyltransferase [Umezakia ovalisporum FSS-44]MDH609522
MCKYIAIKNLIYSYLLYVLSISTSNNRLTSIKTRKFSLYKVRDHSRVLYISGVALGEAKSHNQTTMELASGIVSHLSAISEDVFAVQTVPPGWIYLQLTHPFLASWLQTLVTRSLGENWERDKGKITIQHQSRLFAIQYAHARCYSLLLLAHREGLIKLREPMPNMSENCGGHQPSLVSLVSVEQIPWLKDDQTLRLNHPAEARLTAQLIQVIDNLEFPDVCDVVNWEKMALNLSQAVEVFWCQCPIWGEVKISSPELAQARLGLMIATQSVLSYLLVNKLGSFAPLEL